MMVDRRAHGATIRAFRQARGMHLQTLADRTGMVSRGHLSHIENGRYRATEPLTRALAGVLGVPAEALTGQLPAIADLRSILGIADHDLAAAAGLTTETLIRVEQGVEPLTESEIGRVAARLGVDPAALAPAFGISAVA